MHKHQQEKDEEEEKGKTLISAKKGFLGADALVPGTKF